MRAARREIAEQLLDLVEAEAVRLGHEHGQLARVEHVAVERDVDGVGAFERAFDRAVSRLDARRLDELDLGRVEVARADERDVCAAARRRRRSASAAASPTRSRTATTRGVFRSPCASSQTTARLVLAGRERLDRADVRAAAAAEDERPLGQLGGEREGLLRERVLLDDAASG